MPDSCSNPVCRLALDPTDRTAWTAAVEVYGSLCWRIALRMLGDREAAADAVQDSLLAVRNAAPRFKAGDDPDGAAVAWVARVTVNTCHAHRRRQRPTAALPAAAAAAEPAPPDEMLPLLREAIAELPASLREAVSLRYLAGLDNTAVAASLGIEPGAVRVRVHRAIEALRSLLARRGAVVTALVLAGLLEGIASAEPPPLPAERVAELAAAPLPAPTAAASALAVAAAIGSGVLAAGLAAWIVLRQPAAAPEANALAPPAMAAPAIAATRATDAIEPMRLFPGPDLAGWAIDRGEWRADEGVIIGTVSPTRGGRMHSLRDFADGRLTCRMRVQGPGPGVRCEIQFGDYARFFSILATDGAWVDLRIEHRGETLTCLRDGLPVPIEIGNPAIPAPFAGPIGLYIGSSGTVEIADARFQPFAAAPPPGRPPPAP